MGFITIPIVTWVLCGSIKFGGNVLRAGHDAFSRIGHGGFPSNHTAVLSSIMWALVLVGEWMMAGLALAVLMIHVFDAVGLRREIGYHAIAINKLSDSSLREIIGHNGWDISAGLVVGFTVAATYWWTGAIP